MSITVTVDPATAGANLHARLAEAMTTAPTVNTGEMARSIAVREVDRAYGILGARTGRMTSSSRDRGARWMHIAVDEMTNERVSADAFRSAYMGVDYGVDRDSLYNRLMYGVSSDDLYRHMIPGDWDMPAQQKPIEPAAKVDAPSRTLLVRTAVTVDDGTGDARAKLAIEAETLLGYTPLREHVKVTGLLRRVLAKLEIEPLDEASVNAYKAQMVRHYDTHGKMQMPTWRLKKLSDFALPVPEFVLRKAVDIKKELPQAEFYVDHLAVDPFLIVSLEAIPDGVFNVPSRNLDPETQAYIEVWDEPKFEEGM